MAGSGSASSSSQRREEGKRESIDERGREQAAPVNRRKVHHLPSKAEIDAHNSCHLPYRPWCRACVAGRKPNWPHVTGVQPRPEEAVPEVHMDYCFLRNTEAAVAVPTLVLKDKATHAVAAHTGPYKGGDSEWVVDQVC